MNNNNKNKGRPKVSIKKDQRITFRLTPAELTSIKENLDKAGFKTPSAFIRQHLLAINPKQKVIVPLASMQLALELQRVAGLISKGVDPQLVIEALHNINNKILGIQS